MGQEELTGDPNPNKGWCTLIFKNNQHGLSFKKKVWSHATKHHMLVNTHLSSVCREWGAFMYLKSFFFSLSCIIYFSVYRFNKIRCLSGGPVSLNVFFSWDFYLSPPSLLPSFRQAEQKSDLHLFKPSAYRHFDRSVFVFYKLCHCWDSPALISLLWPI